MQDSESDDCSDSDYEEVDFENSGSDSSVCSLIEDDSSNDSDADDLAELVNGVQFKKRSCHLNLLVLLLLGTQV